MNSDRRDSGLDLLRIVSMLMIVLLHCIGWSGICDVVVDNTFNWYGIYTIRCFCGVCVNCFILISGYFMCKSTFRLRKIFNIWSTALFYSVILYIISVFINGDNISIIELIKRCFVITWTRYWFVTAYILLYLSIPLLNIIIRNMNRKQHQLCCIILLLIASIIPNITLFGNDFSGVGQGSNYLWFCVLYFIAAYLRLYVQKTEFGKTRFLFIWIAVSLLITFVFFIDHFYGLFCGGAIFWPNNSIPCVIASISLFQYMRSISIKKQLIISIVDFWVPLVFAVYLIHMQKDFLPILWNFFKIKEYAASSMLLFIIVGSSLSIFVLSCLVEWCRKKIFSVLRISKLIDYVADILQKRIEKGLCNE